MEHTISICRDSRQGDCQKKLTLKTAHQVCNET